MAGGRLIPRSQYGEDEYIVRLFGGAGNGVLVDVGAADGYHHSNAHRLITDYGWYGVLVEPHPVLAASCRERYRAYPRARVVEAAVKGFTGKTVLHLYEPAYYGQVSTTIGAFQDRVIEQHGDQYTKAVAVVALPLCNILRDCAIFDVDFVNIDCEGSEVEALETFPWETQTPKLFCIEMAYEIPTIEKIFTEQHYRRLSVPRQIHNALYTPESRYDEYQRLLNA